jgi:hypothetical protein
VSAGRRPIVIGSGGIGAADRIEPGLDLADSGLIDYLSFDCLAERTLALAQIRRLADASSGYDDRVPDIVAGLAGFFRAGKRLVGNFGAANPDGAALAATGALRKAGLDGTLVGVIRGDECRQAVLDHDIALPEMGCRVSDMESRLVSAHAYIGAEPIVELLAEGCQVVIGGRIADPSVYVGPICHELGWALDDWDKVATATLVAHLLECGIGRGGKVDPLAEPGYPMATVTDAGDVEITKLAGTDGRIDATAVKLHLGYEVHDPSAYLTPDISVDFSHVWVTDLGDNRVRVGGARGNPRPETLKVLVGLDLGWKVVAEVSLGGRGCVERAGIAAEITRRRLEPVWDQISDSRTDIHGYNALFGAQLQGGYPADVRLRVAFRCDTREAADAAARAGNQLYSAAKGGGGVVVHVTPAIGVTPGLLPRAAVPLQTEVVPA